MPENRCTTVLDPGTGKGKSNDTLTKGKLVVLMSL